MKTINIDLNKKIEDLFVENDSIIKSILIPLDDRLIQNDFNIRFPHGDIKSEIIFKIAVLGKCNISINPTVIIEKGMNEIDCRLKIQVLCDTDDPIIKVTPALECMEPDVKLSHSLTISTFDSDQIEYLYSRGIEEKQAKGLLIEAFTSDIIQS